MHRHRSHAVAVSKPDNALALLTVSFHLSRGGSGFSNRHSPAMATHAMAIAAAPILSPTPGAETSFPFLRSSKESCSRAWLTSGRVNTAQRGFALYAGRRSAGPPGKRPRSGAQARRKQKSRLVEDGDDDDAAMEKALEALFTQLDLDLNAGEEDDDGEEFTNEELEQMTKELEAAFSGIDVNGLEDGEDGEEEDDPGLVDMVMTDGVYSEASGAAKVSTQKNRKQEYDYFGSVDEDDDDDDEDYDEEDDGEQRTVPLEKWQIRRLAASAEKGRRKVNVKSLAAELRMDRSDVLSFLKDPPAELMLMAAQWDSEDEAAAAAAAARPKVEFEFNVDVVGKAPTTAAPRQQPMAPPTPSRGPQVPRNWHGSKRLKKEHIATFERVYRQSSRPSNSMIENLVNLTHVPRKKILQWFDDKRAENRPQKQSFEEAPEN